MLYLRHPAHRRFTLLVLAAVLVAAHGCGSGDGETLIPVSGKVTVAGKPLTRGSISFRPEQGPGNTTTAEPYGDISADGTYTLYTAKKRGAPAGKYVVLITATEDIDPNNPSATPKSLIDRKYGDPDRPLLHAEVVEKPNPGQYDFQIPR